ncbi:hypothetical protein ACERK3_00075 [Phycisphaerales bacterium AB-hyl4]|uniref:Uncharacterized protein n=1 Tax=Natronomicrosphaera hydrolytica TaxID=3242702 RepID=A0ABV4TZZ0_9BACT
MFHYFGRAFVVIVSLTLLSYAGMTADAFGAESVSGRNMLPNASFEYADVVREVYPTIGEYRHDASVSWVLDADEAWHGEQSLRMEGRRPYVWQVLNRRALESVFSVHLKGSRAGQEVELGIENVRVGNETGVWVLGRTTKTVTLDEQWQRHAVASEVTSEEIEAAWAYTGEMGPDLFRVWVRPKSEDALWVDAAQLERDRTQPSAFNPERTDNALHRSHDHVRQHTFIEGPVESPTGEGGESRRGVVAMVVRESAGLARVNEPVWGGVPFPRGELFDAQLVKVVDAAGTRVPVQTRVLDRWHRDGSVRALLIDLQATVDADDTQTYELHYGEAGGASDNQLAHDDGEVIRIDTDVMSLAVRKDRFDGVAVEHRDGRRLTGDVELFGSEVVALDGTPYRSAWGPPAEVRIESNGPKRAVIYIRGEHYRQDGQATLLEYELRLHAFKGKAYVEIEHTFENAEPQLSTAIRSHGLHLPVFHDGEGRVPVRFGLLNGEVLEATATAEAPAALTQVRNYFGEGGDVVLLDREHDTDLHKGQRAAGWVQAGGVSMAVEDFWQLNPKAIEVAPGRLSVYHWPTRHVRYVDLPFGMSNTMRFVYAPFAAQADHGERDQMPAVRLTTDAGDTRTTMPLLLQPDAQWMADSGVFGGKYLTRDAAMHAYPGYERRLEQLFAGLKHDREVVGLTGMWDYGDFGTPHGWMNNETTIARNLWWQYLRTGDPALYRRAWIKTRHYRDVDILYAAPGVRMVHHHAGAYHISTIHHTGHYWITGVIWHYLLTGDERSYRVAMESGTNLMTRYRGVREWRALSRPLYHLAELYELTGLHSFRHAFETLYTSDSPWPSDEYAGGKLVMALHNWYEMTGDEAVRQRLVEHAREVLADRRQRRVDGSRSNAYYQAMAHAAEAADDAEFIEASMEHLVWQLVSLHGFDHNAVRIAPFLRTAQRFGVSADPLMPDYTFDLAPLTGRRAGSFRLQQPNPDGEPIELKIYYTRNFRIERRDDDNERGDAIAYRIRRPDGSELAAGKLTGRDYDALRVTDDGQAGNYDITIEVFNDAMGEVSVNMPGLRVAAHRSFDTRRDRGGSVVHQYLLRAPRDRDAIEMTLDWPDRESRFAASAAGVWLEDLDGNVIAAQRWGTPVGTIFDAEGQIVPTTVDRWKFPIPETHRGQLLRLTYFPLKWMPWQVHGLDEPWLGRSREAFE